MYWVRRTSFAIAVLAAAPSLVRGGAICGPGNHWVDSCAGGIYDFNSVSTVALSLDLDANGTLETTIPFLQLNGLTRVFLGAGSPHTLPSELFYMFEIAPSAFGSIMIWAGDGTANLASDGQRYSPGNIVESGNPALADSFFDVFFQIDIPLSSGPPLELYNHSPMQVRCLGLSQAPPAACYYEMLNQPLDLFLSGGTVPAGQLSTPPGSVHHYVTPIPIPEPATWMLAGAGFGLLWIRRRLR